MPANRSVRRDVIIRVPKIDVKTRRASNTGVQVADVDERGNHHRRSTSPSKRSTLHTEADMTRQSDSTKSDPYGKEYEFAAQATSTAEWNSLLIWARRQRGPQWDAATGLWQVDQFSSDYYSFGNDPARHTKLSTVTTNTNTNTKEEAASRGNMLGSNIKAMDETHILSNDEGEAEGGNESGHNIHGYGGGVEDSPPIGPGGRRSRAR